MRTDPRLILAAAACVSALAVSPAAAQQRSSECDRACLIETANEFLDAVGASDASLLDWNAYARWTLNGVELPFSEAIWGLENETPDAPRIVVPDEKSGEVGLVTTWTFDGTPALMAARLKIEWGRLSEAETIVVTQPGPSGPPGAQVPPPPGPQFAELGAPDPVFSQPVEEVDTRENLIGLADRYLQFAASGFAPTGCRGLQNGAEFNCGPAAFPVNEIAPRRYLADPARGLVFVIARFNDDGVASGAAPSSTLSALVIKIDEQKEIAVESVGERVFYSLSTGWDGE